MTSTADVDSRDSEEANVWEEDAECYVDMKGRDGLGEKMHR